MADITLLIKAKNEASAALQSAKGDMQSLADTAAAMRTAGMGLTAGITLPLVGIAGAAVTSAADFEQALNVMQQVSGATESQMAALQDQALQLGAETSFSAGEAAAGMLELAKAGLSAEEVGAAIGGTMDLAAAGNLDLARAAEIAANAVNVFGLNADDTVGVANMMAAAANASSVEVTDLAAGMQMAGSVFASSGQSIDDLTTALAVMGNAGIKGSDAGTSLKTMLMRLSAPTGEAADLMQQLGISMYNLDGTARALPDVMADLQGALYGTQAVQVTSSNLTAEQAERMDYLKTTIEKTQRQLADYQSGVAGVAQSENDKVVAVDRLNRVLQAAQTEYSGLAAVGGTTSTVMRQMTDETRAAALTTIFGADAIRAVNVLMAEGQDGWAAMSEAVGVQGAATEVANARMRGMAGAIEYIKGSIDSFLIGTALPYLDTMGGIVRQAADAITWFGALPEPIKQAALAFAAVLAAAGPLLLALSGIATAIGFLLSPIGLVIVGVAALAAAWTMNFGGIQEKTAQVWATIQPYLQAAWDWLQAQIPGALATMQAAWDTTWGVVSATATAAWGVVQPYLQAAWDWFQTNLPGALTTLQTAWDTAWAAMPAVVSTAWATIQTATTAAWAVIAPVVQQSIDGFTNYALSVADAGFGSIEAQESMSLFPAALQPVVAAMDSVGASIQRAWGAGFPQVMAAAQTAWAALLELLEPALGRLQTAFATAQEQVGALGPKFGELWLAVQNMWAAMQPILEAFGALVAGTIAVTAVVAVNALAQAFTSFGTIAGAVIDQITLTLNTFATIMGETVTLVKAIMEGDWKTAWASAQNIVGAFKSFFEGTFGNLKIIATTIMTAIQTTVKNTLTDLNVDGGVVMNSIKAWWDSIWTAMSEKIKPVTDAVATLRTALEGFKTWLSELQLPNPFAGIAGAADSIKNAVSNLTGGGGVPGSQLGTSYFGGGWSWVGEAGPELVRLPRGAEVVPNRRSEAMATAASGIAVTIQQMIVRDDKDIYALAYQVADVLARG